jgi:hypothetical protein
MSEKCLQIDSSFCRLHLPVFECLRTHHCLDELLLEPFVDNLG